ncbi:Tetraspanin-11 [Trichoplax sp. H2]|uniref:Tetraspanin n=1 Tax=Trichoplax adhaerens TaxID=10228 RepID=B3RLW5_TRIAD|nr:hypothetical protein TRIADDRAFT_63517 [Trichoplax adhaerens]EDV28857.1 hypothetical protein TRIADDRAFT_63517 [Trichoplax adhaerens]RDD46657.1 Tetraspanin-11 [Trichoplax sp. H2]|eukprot:XP_002108059.1 hypothetical protein TRIADDRAFT_63517 [Trichoplax adhaerens]
MGCGNLSRILLIVFNFIFVLSGFAVIGLAGYNLATYWDIATIAADSAVTIGTILLLTAGIITTLAGILGFCGSLNRHPGMLLGFFILLLLIFGFEVAAGIYTVVHRQEVIDALRTKLSNDIQNKYTPNNLGIQRGLNAIQTQFKCCGSSNYTDWARSTWGAGKTIAYPVPDSCCKVYVPGCGLDEVQRGGANLTGINLNGCVQSVSNTISENAYIILGVGVGIGALQIFGMVCSMILYCDLKEDKD